MVGSVATALPAAAALSAGAQTASAPVASLSLAQANWQQALFDQVQDKLAAAQPGSMHEARIDLHPQELGAMTVRIAIGSGTAQVQFAADNPAARAALQNALPQLQQMFTAAGLALPQVEVMAQFSGGGSSHQPPPRPTQNQDSGPVESVAPASAPRRRISAAGAVDDYA